MDGALHIDLAILDVLALDSDTVFGNLVAASLRKSAAKDAESQRSTQTTSAGLERIELAHEQAFFLWLDLTFLAQVKDLRRYTRYLTMRLCSRISVPQSLPPGILPHRAAPHDRALFLSDLALAVEALEGEAGPRNRTPDPPRDASEEDV